MYLTISTLNPHPLFYYKNLCRPNKFREYMGSLAQREIKRGEILESVTYDFYINFMIEFV